MESSDKNTIVVNFVFFTSLEKEQDWSRKNSFSLPMEGVSNEELNVFEWLVSPIKTQMTYHRSLLIP